ncbi:4Fe-4S dicluster domain-containing protein [Tissierella sp.]|uniref:4Fe-4S dicluster domain-containing protein n=1 Tax=Tissierella sp. TaxID=41274 RepID=UPI0028587506|nr:4Fe-4S dicluster domain-containing protein [Tissierella sp.]MDR7857406.1 4Fe-4S dicluster domain-containing protein [Tissierella sp.]
MRKFDTKIQHLKYKVLREVGRAAWNDSLLESINDLHKKIISKNHSSMRCCIYKERAILSERVNLAMGGDSKNPNVIEVIDIACDECPASGFEVTHVCRGCLAHRCEDVCKLGAIIFDSEQRAIIDKSKCVNCGACAKVCPYGAIINEKRPCENACKIKAITMAEGGEAKIDNEKCISCGACVYQCPFGAISDKSFILDVIRLIKGSKNNEDYKVYAVVAPSISSQFTYAKLGQVISGIKVLGFHTVVEAALGADLVAWDETVELIEKGFLTSSCCPAFVDYINKQFPTMIEHISHNPSPMVAMGKYIKDREPNAKVVFIGPCTAKKMEFQKPEILKYVDSVITFEELQALFDSKDIDIATLSEDVLDNSSYYGRIFARSGGLSDAVAQGLKEQGIEDFDLKAVACDGIEECRMALLKASKGVPIGNFIEGMACAGGCIGGAGCLTHGDKNKSEVDKYGREALEKTIKDAISLLK